MSSPEEFELNVVGISKRDHRIRGVAEVLDSCVTEVVTHRPRGKADLGSMVISI